MRQSLMDKLRQIHGDLIIWEDIELETYEHDGADEIGAFAASRVKALKRDMLLEVAKHVAKIKEYERKNPETAKAEKDELLEKELAKSRGEDIEQSNSMYEPK